MDSEQYSCTKCAKCGEVQYSGDHEHFAAVKCRVCGKLHDINGDTFVVVSGDITRGVKGGLVGPNLKNDMVVKSSIFCVGQCFKKVCAAALVLDFDDTPVIEEDIINTDDPNSEEYDMAKDYFSGQTELEDKFNDGVGE